jgi:hypothetical protein
LAPPTNFDTTRIRFGDLVAAGSGLLLIISPFLEWYNITAKNNIVNFSIGGSGWDVLSWVPWLITLIGLAAIGLAVARGLNSVPPNLPASPGFIVLVLGGLATIFVLFRLLVVPDSGAGSGLVDVGRSFGLFVAFIAAVGVTIGGWLTWNEEGKPRPGGAPGRAGAPPATAPLPGGQPYAGAQPQAPAQPQQAAYTPPAAATPAAQAEPAAAAQPAGGAAKADWYPDPRGEKRLRYWDGSQWTDHTAD